MIEILKNFPDNVVAISCGGQVTKEDYEGVFVPAILKALKGHDKIRLFYETSANFTGYDPGAIWEDLKIGVEHLNRWERIAVVTDVDWIVQMIRIFSFLMPCLAKLFPPSEAPQAKAWITAAS
ncbi:MAG: STAS/SEC14 domain-containing protein [Terracidiphilus sp.]